MDIFGPQLQGYQTENPLKSMADVQTLYGNQQIQQKNALMLQQQQQEMQQTNALMQVVRQPGVINQETGDVTPHGQNAMMGVAPLVAPKLIQQMALARQERTKSAVNELQAGMERLKINKMGAEALADAYTGMDEAYKAAVPTMGEQGARNYVNEQIRPDFEKKLKTGGLLPPEVTDKIGGTYDPEKNRIALAAATSHAERLKQQERHPSDSILMQAGKDTFLVSKDKGVQAWFPEEQKFVSGKFQLPEGARPINVASTEQAAEKAGAIEGAKTAARAAATPGGYASGYANMSPEKQATVDFYADMQAAGITNWRTGLSRNKEGSDLIRAVDERVPARQAELGKTSADVGTNMAIRTATQSALTQNTKDLAMLKPYVAMLDQNSDILKGLAKKAIATNSALANRPLNWLRTNMADSPDVAEYLAQVEIVKNEATRVISNPRLVGQMTDTARQEIESIINGTMPLNATDRVLDRIQNDGHRRITTTEDQQKQLQDTMRKMFPGGGNTAPSTGGQSKYEAGKEYKDAQGNRARYNADGTWTELGK